MKFANNKSKTVIIIQARMGSTRLPGKILKKVMGRALLDYQIERLRQIKEVDDIVVATSKNQTDDSVVDFCKQINCNYHRSSENDVLLRYFETAIEFNAKNIVRVNADCPLIDPSVVKKVLMFFRTNSDHYDYVSNILEPSYPIGLHTEVFSFDTLKKANDNSEDPIEREHVTPYIYRNPKDFRLGSIVLDENLCHYRWTVDYPEDFDLVKKIIEGIYPKNNNFDMFDIISFLKSNSSFISINSQFKKEQTL